MAQTITREEYLQQRRNNDVRMHETKVKEREAVRNLTLHYEDLLRDNEQEYRRKRDALRAERDAKREDIENMFKDERRQIWEENSELATRWRAQIISDTEA